ncbi:MAG: diguanylate cyclase [Butyrivibrio sp.]|nr:diguanylate cyclase [Butyrivibrio sp.]
MNRFSLRKKTILLMASVSILLCIAASLSGGAMIVHVINRDNIAKATSISANMAGALNAQDVAKVRDAVQAVYDSDPDRVSNSKRGTAAYNDYVARYERIMLMPEYQDLLARLRRTTKVSQLDSAYLVWMDERTEASVYLVDGGTDPCPPGSFDPFYLKNRNNRTPVGEKPETRANYTPEYGWLVTAACPVMYDGEYVAYAAVDIAIGAILNEIINYVIGLALILLIISVFLVMIGVNLVGKYIVSPITELSAVAMKYTESDKDTEQHRFEHLEIHTGDEIEDLVNAMKQMVADLNYHVEELSVTRVKLDDSRSNAIDIAEQEQRDPLTGIRNRIACARALERITFDLRHGSVAFALVAANLPTLKAINEKYGVEKGNRAIVSCCSTFCHVFEHSPVFRIGGDEFLAILKGNDYENRAQLMQTYQDRVAALAADGSVADWEKVPMTLGIAVYEEGRDAGVEDVYRRALEDLKRTPVQ